MALAVFGIAAVGIFSAFRYAQAASFAAEDRLRAVLLATDLVDEVRSRALVEPDTGVASAWGREAGEAGADRSVLDDIDDYDGLEEAPPRDPVGAPIPGLDGWSRRVEVETVEVDDPSRTATSGTTPLRRVRVTVSRSGEGSGPVVLIDISVLAAGR